jgi:NAD(P)-dependent dehydrogenase (short-subunit alcohol dehydrogenase family)
LGEATAAEIVAQGGAAIHLWGSIANPGHVDDIFDEIQRRYGFLDILVCNASDGRLGRFLEITADDMERAFRTNVIGHHHCARRASPLMQRRGGGAIVTMSSIAARRFVEGLGAQGVVKAAVESLTRHLACELGGFGIRTNCVAGGPVYGQVLSNYPDARATLNYWETLIPDGELCTPSDLARTVAFLVSDEARGVNGAVWNVDHGLATRSHSRPLPRVQSDVADPTEVH